MRSLRHTHAHPRLRRYEKWLAVGAKVCESEVQLNGMAGLANVPMRKLKLDEAAALNRKVNQPPL